MNHVDLIVLHWYESFHIELKTGPPSYLQHIDQDHGVGDVTVELLLLGHVGQIDESPGDDAGPAVEEQLEVEPLSNAGVELDAHHVVVEDVPGELAVASPTEENMMKKTTSKFYSFFCIK